ncbi:hypothetical protein [Nonomuraea coxensis]|nr:hypothetical protein [Nonomuraea coxensis]
MEAGVCHPDHISGPAAVRPFHEQATVAMCTAVATAIGYAAAALPAIVTASGAAGRVVRFGGKHRQPAKIPALPERRIAGGR